MKLSGCFDADLVLQVPVLWYLSILIFQFKCWILTDEWLMNYAQRESNGGQIQWRHRPEWRRRRRERRRGDAAAPQRLRGLLNAKRSSKGPLRFRNESLPVPRDSGFFFSPPGTWKIANGIAEVKIKEKQYIPFILQKYNFLKANCSLWDLNPHPLSWRAEKEDVCLIHREVPTILISSHKWCTYAEADIGGRKRRVILYYCISRRMLAVFPQ